MKSGGDLSRLLKELGEKAKLINDTLEKEEMEKVVFKQA